jgi:hypothetical protein
MDTPPYGDLVAQDLDAVEIAMFVALVFLMPVLISAPFKWDPHVNSCFGAS